MTHTGLSGTTAIVTGASRGFGLAIAEALVEAGACVVGVARDGARLEALRARLGDGFIPAAGDAPLVEPPAESFASRSGCTRRPSS